MLDSPSVAGAYRFGITLGEVLTMDVDAALYPRRAIERIGIAPCTSMYQTGENDRRMANDWRPELHDSNGLQLFTGAGEWIWRPLVASGTAVEPVIEVSRGRVEITSARPLAAVGGIRAMFDLVPDGDGAEPVALRMYLHSGGTAVSETWLYEWAPPGPA